MGIKADTLLRFTNNGREVIITPMKVMGNGIFEMHRKLELSNEEIGSFVDEISADSLARMMPVIAKKLNRSAGAESGSTDKS